MDLICSHLPLGDVDFLAVLILVNDFVVADENVVAFAPAQDGGLIAGADFPFGSIIQFDYIAVCGDVVDAGLVAGVHRSVARNSAVIPAINNRILILSLTSL